MEQFSVVSDRWDEQRESLSRRNFLPYNYVAHRLCELNGYNDLLPLFHWTRKYDDLWEKIRP